MKRGRLSPWPKHTVEGDRLHFEFAADNREVKITAAELRRRINKLSAATE